MERWKIALLVCAFACGCEKKQAPPKTDFEAFERKFVAEQKELVRSKPATSYRAIYVGASGLWIDRTLVATLAEIESKRGAINAALDENAKLMAMIGYDGMMVTFDLDTQPASVAIAALQLLVGRQMEILMRREDPEVAFRATMPICRGKIRSVRKHEDADIVNLSLLVEKERTWVGVSRVNEFQEIPRLESHDYEKIEMTLKQHKASAFFIDRNDIELAVADGTAEEAMMMLNIACDVGFVDVAVFKRDQLSAKPAL